MQDDNPHTTDDPRSSAWTGRAYHEVIHELGYTIVGELVSLRMAFDLLERAETFEDQQVGEEFQRVDQTLAMLKSAMAYAHFVTSAENGDPTMVRREYLEHSENLIVKHWIINNADLVPLFEVTLHTVIEATEQGEAYLLHVRGQTDVIAKPTRPLSGSSSTIGSIVNDGLRNVAGVRAGVKTAEAYLAYLAKGE